MNMDKRYFLTEEQLASFEKNGFIGPLTIYTPEDMHAIWNEVRRALPDRSSAAYPADSFGSGTNISNYDRHLDVDKLAEHVTNLKIVSPVTGILGPDVICWRTEFSQNTQAMKAPIGIRPTRLPTPVVSRKFCGQVKPSPLLGKVH